MRARRKLKPTGIFLILAVICLIIFGSVLAIRSLLPEDKPDVEIDTPVEPDENIEITPDEPQDETIIDVPSSDEPSKPDEPEKPEVDKETRLSFVAVGDNIIHEAVFLDAKRLADERGLGEDYYFDPMYERFEDIFKNADISFLNQETMVGDAYRATGYPSFFGPSEVAETLDRLGLDVVNLASNHVYDLRGAGVVDCIETFNKTSITTIGAYLNREDYENIRVIEKEGIKIAFLSYTYGTNGYTAGSGYEQLIVPLIDEVEIAKEIRRAKEISDLVFVSMHWGTDSTDQFLPVSNAQRVTAQAIVDAGADVIIGHHPHVIQELKWKERGDGGKTLIAYSLGNFISTQHNSANLFGGMLTFDIVKNESGAGIENVLFVPTMTHYSTKRDSLKAYLLEDYTEELYATHGTLLKDASWNLEKVINKVRETIDEEFLEDWIKQ